MYHSYWFWLSGVWGNLLAGDEVVGVRVLDGDNDDVRTTFFPLSFDVRGSVALTDQVRLVGDLLRRDLSLKVLGLGDGLNCEPPPEAFDWLAAARAAACMYAGSAIFHVLQSANSLKRKFYFLNYVWQIEFYISFKLQTKKASGPKKEKNLVAFHTHFEWV